MKYTLILSLVFISFLVGCGNSEGKNTQSSTETTTSSPQPEVVDSAKQPPRVPSLE